MTFLRKQQILFILATTIATAMVGYFWKEIGGKDSFVSLFIRGFIGGIIGIMILRFVNLKKNKALNDHP